MKKKETVESKDQGGPGRKWSGRIRSWWYVKDWWFVSRLLVRVTETSTSSQHSDLSFYETPLLLLSVYMCMYVQVICEKTSGWTSWWVEEEVWLQDNGESMGRGVLPGRQRI